MCVGVRARAIASSFYMRETIVFSIHAGTLEQEEGTERRAFPEKDL